MNYLRGRNSSQEIPALYRNLKVEIFAAASKLDG